MKRMLTFIYGLLILLASCLFNYKFENEHGWLRYFYLILCILSAWDAIEKFNKATK